VEFRVPIREISCFMNRKYFFSGIQPSGKIHIGNYLGAIKSWIKLQNTYNGIFGIVDYHAITEPYEASQMPKQILNAAIDYIAAGIDSKKSILMIQSHVPEHTELAWILNCITPVSWLEKIPTFKEKARQFKENVNMGLMDYPVLMAADIMLYKSTIVPVGEDQLPHIELTRMIVRTFNSRYGKTFPEPEAYLSRGAKIFSLTQPAKKMSKSFGPESYIALSDEPKIIEKKLATAVTDPARKRRTDKGNPYICNLFNLHKLFSSLQEIKKIEDGCRSAGIGCLECKKLLAKNISQELEPIRLKQLELAKKPEYIKKILEDGSKRARKIAQGTLKEVKKKIGLL